MALSRNRISTQESQERKRCKARDNNSNKKKERKKKITDVSLVYFNFCIICTPGCPHPPPSRAHTPLHPALWLPNSIKRSDLPGDTLSMCPPSPSTRRSEFSLWTVQQSGSQWTSLSSLCLCLTYCQTVTVRMTNQPQARKWMEFMWKTYLYKYPAWPFLRLHLRLLAIAVQSLSLS